MVGIIQETGRSIISPLQSLGDSFLNIFPGIVAAIVILIIGWIVARIVGVVVEKICKQIKLDQLVFERTKLAKVAGKFKLSEFLGLITKWYVFILFLPPTANIINLQPLSTFLLSVAFWIPNVILGLVIAFIGFVAADYIAEKIVETKAKYANMLADIVKIILIIFILIIALKQMKLDISIAESSFLIILSGFMLAISLALGIGFGLAMKDDAKPLIRRIRKKLF